MTQFLCNTNVISEIMKKNPDPLVLEWFSSLSTIGLSVITIEELCYGLRRKSLYHKEAWLRRFVHSAAKVFEVETSDSFWAGEKRGLLSSKGLIMHQADALIAAATYRSSLTLATRNLRDFEDYGIPLFNPWQSDCHVKK